MNNLEKLSEWFLNSQIFNGEAYVSYYSARKQGPVYPEITAYAINLACVLSERMEDKRLIQRAEKCAEYMRGISRNGGIPNFPDNLLYSFDTGIFISALFDLYALSKNDSYLKEAEKSLDWLYSLWNGKLFSAVDPLPDERRWYHFSAIHLAKLAIPLLKAAEFLKDKKYEAAALTLLHEYKQLQEEDGRFRLNQDSAETWAHPHCYATEGYLYAYHVTQNKEFLDIVLKAANWLREVQNEDGSLYRVYSPQGEGHLQRPEKLKTADATAQSTRIWKLLAINENNIEKAYEYLNSELDGGLRLFRTESLKAKLFSWVRPVYSWPTFFYIHSISLPFGESAFTRELF